MFDKIKINILYIDDNKDADLSFYLTENLQKDKYFEQNGIDLIITEYKFKSEKYDELLNKEEIKKANIIIIDSMLFNDQDDVNNKFTGEEFSIVLKKTNPYISVIVITQNNLTETDKFGIVKKYFSNSKEDVTTYYDRELKDIIKDRIMQLKYDREKILKLDENKNIEKIIVDKIKNLLSGSLEYNEISKKDIDELIVNFKNIEKIIKDQK